MKKLLLVIITLIGFSTCTFAQITTTQNVNKLAIAPTVEVVKIKAKLHNSVEAKELIVSKINDRYFFEGDIEIPKETIIMESILSPLQLKSVIEDKRVQRSLAVRNAPFLNNQFRWPQGIIPFEIDLSGIDNSILADQILEIEEAIAHINEKSNLCIRERDGEYDFVKFIWDIDLGFNGGSSAAGNTPLVGEQSLSLFHDSDIIHKGTIIHELLHAAGLLHEQSRSDRDDFIRINWENIEPGSEFQFMQYGVLSMDINDYDYESIMHYGRTAFSRRNEDGTLAGNTIDCINIHEDSCPIGSRDELSEGDINGINYIYPTKSCGHQGSDFIVESNTYYQVKHVRTGNYLGNIVGGAADGERVSLMPKNFYKEWKLERIQGSLDTYFIVLKGFENNRRVLEAGFKDKTIQLWKRLEPNMTRNNQHWIVKQLPDGDFTIKNVKFDQYLYVKNDGTVILNDPGSYKKYHWKFESTDD